ncbi:hypothetical protein TM49_16860 [Martelella endophytica]|uniref:Uncharacterized protein n=1 Tax=Martelella endophytica TaxID=1486262 RepID=A0A0D5LT95_MAREN|nr:hypothetical protein TM49_16860 [Martelella endophytica]
MAQPGEAVTDGFQDIGCTVTVLDISDTLAVDDTGRGRGLAPLQPNHVPPNRLDSEGNHG